MRIQEKIFSLNVWKSENQKVKKLRIHFALTTVPAKWERLTKLTTVVFKIP